MLIKAWQNRLSQYSNGRAHGVFPSVCCSWEVNLDAALEKYHQDLPSVELFSGELRRWIRKCKNMPADERSVTAAQAIKMCDLTDCFYSASNIMWMWKECKWIAAPSQLHVCINGGADVIKFGANACALRQRSGLRSSCWLNLKASPMGIIITARLH